MLTVLWRKPDGAELIFPALQIERMQKEGEQSVPVLNNCFRVWGESPSTPGDHFEITLEKPFGAVFVMNQHGTTVARYLAD